LIFFLERNEKAKESAKKYMWMLDEDIVLDPTNPDGQLSPAINYFFGFFRAETLLARINEPPVGKDCNVISKASPNGELEIIAERDIISGGEYISILLIIL
jgi:hypothetical protein